MKIKIYILGNYKPGDADGLAEFNAENVHLLKDLFEFHFVQFNAQANRSYYNYESINGISIHTFGNAGWAINYLPRLLVNWIRKLPKENRIFHLSHIYNLPNYFIARQLVKLQIPYIITPHDTYVYSKAFRKDKPLIKRIYRTLFTNLFDRYVLEHSAVIHGITSQCALHLKDFTRKEVRVVYNQVNDINWNVTMSSESTQVVFIGRFNVESKGIDVALKAFKLYKSGSTKNDHVQFILVGPADSRATKLCLEICESLKLDVGKDVEFTGKVSTEQRIKILQNSKVYLHLARREGFGLSVAQALSSYTPVIVSRQVPISDQILKYNAGFAVNNAEEAAQALERIISLSPMEYEVVARNARRCYEMEFHPNVIKLQLFDLYASCVKHN